MNHSDADSRLYESEPDALGRGLTVHQDPHDGLLFSVTSPKRPEPLAATSAALDDDAAAELLHLLAKRHGYAVVRVPDGTDIDGYPTPIGTAIDRGDHIRLDLDRPDGGRYDARALWDIAAASATLATRLEQRSAFVERAAAVFRARDLANLSPEELAAVALSALQGPA
jgi:hypothetical protein